MKLTQNIIIKNEKLVSVRTQIQDASMILNAAIPG